LAAELERLRLGEAAAVKPLVPAHGLGPAASRVYGVAKGVSIGGYGEAIYDNFDARDESGGPSGLTDQFDFVRAVLYAGYKFTDRVVFNSEMEFEHASTETGGSVSVEFAYLDFMLHRHANLRAGLILVPAGLINETHEPPTFLGARRPSVETRIEPATWADNGAGVFGDAGGFSYRAYVLAGLDSSGFTAGEGLREGRQGGGQAKAQDFALAIRGDYVGLPGFLAGAFAYRGGASQGQRAPVGFSVDPNGTPIAPATRPFRAPVSLYDLHAEYRARGVQLRALYARGRLGDAARVNDANGLSGTESVGSRFLGWYAEAGYDVLSRRAGGASSLVPFVRHERFDTQDRVPAAPPRDPDPSPLVQPASFAADPANDVAAWTVGVVYKPIINVSVKLDFQKVTNEAQTGVDQIAFGLGYLF
ncbi:MAG: hypothetical protein HY049_11050, partial [Acidobacteria bacterium]|nr:hypothetical protein [Acidobacteriota bacterium]